MRFSFGRKIFRGCLPSFFTLAVATALAFPFTAPRQAEALALIPYFDVTINKATGAGSGDGNFSFHFRDEFDQPDFNIQTVSGTGSNTVYSAVSNGETVTIYEDAQSGWQGSVVSCSSSGGNERSIFSYATSSVSIKAYPYSKVTCTFISVKAAPPPAKNPVIIVPGIMGSYLSKNYGDQTEIWPNADTMAWSLSDSYLDDLALQSDGSENPEKPMVVGDIVRSITGHLLGFSNTSHIFDGLIAKLEANGYAEGDTLFVFPYDWRKGSAENAAALKNKIDAVLASTSAEKIDIIAHSMGGLVAKEYIAENGGGAVGRLIFIGTPQLGAPLAFKALMYGDDMGINLSGLVSILNPTETKYIIQNMPSVFELLPSKKYVDDLKHPYVRDLVTASPTNSCDAFNLSYADTEQFMIRQGRNPAMFPFADTLHQTIDNLNLSAIKTYDIIGYTGPTVGTITAKKKKVRTFWGGVKIVDDFTLGYVSGDQTVPLASAKAEAGKKFYVADVAHSDLPSSNKVKGTVISILKGESDGNDAVIVAGAGTTTIPAANTLTKLPGIAVSTHATTTMHIYDTSGNHTGPKADGSGIEYGIPNVPYDRINGNTYTFLPYPQGGGGAPLPQYRIVTTREDPNTPAYDFYVAEQNESGSTTAEYYWSDVPLATETAQTETVINLASSTTPLVEEEAPLAQAATGSPYVIATDGNGDNIFETNLPPSAALDEAASADTVPPVTTNTVATSTATTTVTLIAADETAGVFATEISLDGGATWIPYTEPLAVDASATTTLQYFSTDRAGNAEEIQTLVLLPVLVLSPQETPKENDNKDNTITAAVSPAPVSPASGGNGPPIVTASFAANPNPPFPFPVLSLASAPSAETESPQNAAPTLKITEPVQPETPSIPEETTAMNDVGMGTLAPQSPQPNGTESEPAPALKTAPAASANLASAAASGQSIPAVFWIISFVGGGAVLVFLGIKFLNKLK